MKPTEFSYSEKQFGSFIERIVQAGYTRQADGRYLMRATPSMAGRWMLRTPQVLLARTMAYAALAQREFGMNS